MANFMAGSVNGNFPNLKFDILEVISVLINNACNLSCKHCYLQTKRFGKYLDHPEWMQFFASVFDDVNAPTILSFAGKEVFINQKSVSILLDAIKLRNRLQENDFKKTEIGVITNGTLLHNYKSQLLETPPDYIDVSIDGLPEAHNHIRGEGAFEQLAPNLRWLKSDFPGNVWITHTVLENNINSLPRFIEFYHTQYDIDKFSIGFYKQQEYTDTSIRLNLAHYLSFTDKILPALENLTLAKPVEVIMEVDSTQPELLDTLTQAGWANPVDPISSVAHEYNNGLTLRVNTAREPVGRRAVRITPEGYWLTAEDLIHVREYDRRAIANLRDFQFDKKRLYAYQLEKTEDTAAIFSTA